MRSRLSRALLALAMHAMGSRRRAWARAMAAEFDVAERDGHAFSFAFGCVLGAWRTLPYHAEGRLALVGYVVACGICLPLAAALTLATTIGFPFVEATDGIHGFVAGSGSYRSLLDPGSLALGPALTLAMLLLAACHLPLAWWVLERDWSRVGMAMRVAAAILVTLAIVTACAGLNAAALLVPFTALLAEAFAIAGVARFEEMQSGEDLGALP